MSYRGTDRVQVQITVPYTNGRRVITERDEEHEERIEMRIIVDAYTVEEQAYGWHSYWDDMMDFRFEAGV